jgi:superfamily II DNA or RNA helicase
LCPFFDEIIFNFGHTTISVRSRRHFFFGTKMKWTDTRNNTSFVSAVNQFFKTVEKKDGLRYHQILISEYFLKYPVRGLLIFHKMGMGKTKLAATIVDVLAKTMPVIFVSAKTLHQNFENTLQERGRVQYVSLNASNMFSQINAAALTDIEKLLGNHKKMRGSLNGSLVIVDEAHNFFNSISNGSGNATELYKALIKSDCRMLFLTGSPIMNDPFEIALCFNMLAGYPLFPETYRDFKNYFVGPEVIKNEGKFMNRINGMVSYYDGTAKNITVHFPEQRPHILVECNMTPHQYKQYYEARKSEQASKLKKNFQAKEYSLQKGKAQNASYRVMSRQISNFAYPQYALRAHHNEKGKLVEEAEYGLLRDEDIYENLGLYSPKMKKLVDNATTLEGINIIYSQFLKYGLSIIEAYLRQMNKLGNTMKYTVISGEVEKEEVYKRVELVNSPDNKMGELCKIVLISGTASEGVDFKHIMQIHCLEPYWHWSRMQQIFGRGVRANSHIDMPPNMQYVQPYIYVSLHGIKENTEITTDQHLLQKSMRNSRMLDSFFTCMRISAIDCPAHYDNCRFCQATDKKLFGEDIVADMTLGDPCAENKSVAAKIFQYNSETYAQYEVDGEVYFAKLNPVTGKYEKVSENIRIKLLGLKK